MNSLRRASAALLIVAVALAFADASVVALALPDLYGEFDTSIVGVSWVLTTYALAVVICSIPVAVLHRRFAPIRVLNVGIVVFAGASVAAGFANGLTVLLIARAAQGIGATFILAASLPVLGALQPAGTARRAWAMAGAIGAAVGPALGGVLTDLFDWRAIFFVQAPVVSAALVVGAIPAARKVPATTEKSGHGVRRSDVIVANIGFAFVFAALVAALFLGVLMAVEVWRYRPIQGALVVSALPVGMCIGRLLTDVSRRSAAIGGPALLAIGLGGLALLDGAQWELAVLAFALCGVGFDLVHELLDRAAVPSTGATVRASAVSIGARHAGLVLGLALIAPVLSSSIVDGTERATLGATQDILRTDIDLADKINVAWDLRSAIDEVPEGNIPDLDAPFLDNGATSDNALGRSQDTVITTVTAAVTRSFRPAYAIAAAMAVLAMLPALVLARHAETPAAPTSVRGLAAAILFGIVLIAGMVATGAESAGRLTETDPCTAEPDPFPGDGLDASVQRIALSGLNGAACDLGTTPERLVLSLDADSGYRDVTWDEARLARALRVGMNRSIDDAVDRGTLPGFAATALRFVVDKAPIGWLTEQLPSFG